MKVLITPLGVLYIIANCLFGLAALLLLADALFPALIGVLAVNGVAKGEEGALGALVLMLGTTAFVGIFGLVAGAFSLAYLIDGIGLIARKGWARWLGVALAVPLLFICTPFGIVLSVLALLTLLLPDAEAEFLPVAPG